MNRIGVRKYADMSSDFRLLDLARAVVLEIDEIMRTSRPPLRYDSQLREASRSITANIREAYGRREGPERNQFLRYARASADETDERLRPYVSSRHLSEKQFWRLHNRLAVISKIITRLMG